jgi:hypothetical protein
VVADRGVDDVVEEAPARAVAQRVLGGIAAAVLVVAEPEQHVDGVVGLHLGAGADFATVGGPAGAPVEVGCLWRTGHIADGCDHRITGGWVGCVGRAHLPAEQRKGGNSRQDPYLPFHH